MKNKTAYDFGYDCGYNGPNETNSHFSIFSNQQSTDDWTQGKLDGEKAFIKLMNTEMYTDVRRVPNRGWCGIQRFAFTFGLCYGLDETGREGRYCYQTYMEARVALELWDGSENPVGQWKKHKGYSVEFTKQELEDFLNKEESGSEKIK